MRYSNMEKRKCPKQVAKIIAVLLIAILLVFLAWQLNEYRKLKTILLPQNAVYQVPPNLPPIIREAVVQNRTPYFLRSTEQQLDEWAAMVGIQGLISSEDNRIAAEALAARNLQSEQPEWLTYEDVDTELEFLFDYMRYSFALYAYRGGDEVFIPLFENIKTKIHSSGSENRISTDVYIELLRTDILPAVDDLHSYIGSMNYDEVFPEKRYYSYTNDAYVFQLDGDGYWGNIGGVKYRLLQINGQVADLYLQPGILENGAVAYLPWLYTTQADDAVLYTLSLQQENGAIEEKEILLAKVSEYTEKESNIYSLEETEDYFYLRNSSLMSIPSNMDSLTQMVTDAARVRGDKPIIMDLRGHSGGNDYYALFWMLKFLNVSKLQALFLHLPGISYDINTQTTQTLWSGKLAQSVSQPGLVSRYKNGGNPLHIANDTPIYVVIDRGCGSSGEWFAGYLSRLDNVVIVGENTKGMTIGGNQCTVILPISRYKATFSTAVNVDSGLRDLEGCGLSPDVYAPPEKAVELIIAMIKEYKDL